MIVCNLYHCENKAHNNKNNNNFLKVLQTVSSARNQISNSKYFVLIWRKE